MWRFTLIFAVFIRFYICLPKINRDENTSNGVLTSYRFFKMAAVDSPALKVSDVQFVTELETLIQTFCYLWINVTRLKSFKLDGEILIIDRNWKQLEATTTWNTSRKTRNLRRRMIRCGKLASKDAERRQSDLLVLRFNQLSTVRIRAARIDLLSTRVLRRVELLSTTWVSTDVESSYNPQGGPKRTHTWFFFQVCSTTSVSNKSNSARKLPRNASEIVIKQGCNLHTSRLIRWKSLMINGIEISIVLLLLNFRVLELKNKIRTFKMSSYSNNSSTQHSTNQNFTTLNCRCTCNNALCI